MENYNEEIHNILEEENSFDIPQDESWRINDLEGAVWADAIIKEKEDKIRAIELTAQNSIDKLQEKIDRLNEWKEKTVEKDRNGIEFFKQHLHMWHERLIDEEMGNNQALVDAGKKPKKISGTIKLPYRNLTYRAQQPTIMFNGNDVVSMKNDLQLINHVKIINPEFIKEEVKWGDLKKSLKLINGKMCYINEDGESVAEFDVEEKGYKFDWKLIEESTEKD